MCSCNYPLVSVIVPNYNHGRFLNERINSILEQTYDNYEIIILDDKSSDDSLIVIDKFKTNPKIKKVIVNEKNSGSPFSQWEKGIREAVGEIVWIAESDDACNNSFLEKLVDFYQKNDLVMAFATSRKMDKNGILGKIIQNEITKNIVMKGYEYISNHISMITNASSAIFSRACALKIDNNYYEYKGTGDWLFWSGIAAQGLIGIYAQPLNYYRVHDESTTSRFFSNGRDFFELKKVYSFMFDNNYWSRWNYLKKSAQIVYAIKYLYKFDNESIKIKLLKEWKSSSVFNLCFCFLVKVRQYFKNIK